MHLQPGTLLQGGKYRIEKVLGQGSFGITYLASAVMNGSLGTISVKVAIKEFFSKDMNMRKADGSVSEMSSGSLSGKYAAMFQREAKNLSHLEHKGIVNVMESFSENNTHYYVMEYIEGCNLNDYIKSNGCLSECEALENLSQIIEALSCMHNNKMLHLDLKPLNIMRRINGDLVLIDFGLSKQYNSNGEPESSTRIGGGTLGYAPLEQTNYKKEDGFSPTLDIYALGGTLYKMLTGTTPPDASTIFNDGFPEDVMQEMGISKDIISLTSWAMEPMKRKRPQTTGELLKEIKRLSPYASKDKKDASHNYSKACNEPTLAIYEICNGFHVRWNNEITENQKNKIRDLLNAMQPIGVGNQCVSTEYGQEHISNKTIMSLGEDTWHYLYPIIAGDDTDGYFHSHTIPLALKAIQQLTYLTGLPFRLSNEDEIKYLRSAHPGYWENLKTLCFSKNKELQYKTYGTHGGLNDITYSYDWDMETYDIQLICDGMKPLHHQFGFDLPYTQEFVDEISPIGFNLYKTRKGDLWNIKSPESPMYSYLGIDYEMISNIGLWHVPGGGPTSGLDYFGIKAYRSGITYYYSFEKGKFNLMEMLSDEEVEEREMWT